MVEGVPTKLIACCLGLSAFAIAVVAGLAAQNEASTILWRAIGAMAAMYLAGQWIGAAGERVVSERLAQHAKENPMPEEVKSPAV